MLDAVTQGKTNKEIAQALGVSHETVKFHLENAARKLGARGRRAAAVKYRELLAAER